MTASWLCKSFFIYPLAHRRSVMIYYFHFSEHGVVAQLVSALDCRSGGCGFEPRRPRQYGKGKRDCLVV